MSLSDRNIIAFQNALSYSQPSNNQQQDNTSSSNTTSDASLIAIQMKQREEDRRKREDGGFTTKAMRDLERMKKMKVYSHVQLRIYFPDGSFLTAQFLPRETIDDVKSVIASCFLLELKRVLKFDLYASPPRRNLSGTQTLTEEGLVPAAKLYISWNNTSAPLPPSSSIGAFLKQELFQTTNNNNNNNNNNTSNNHSSNATATNSMLYPHAKPIVDETNNKQSKNKSTDNNNNTSSGNNRQDAMLRKMMGKKTSLLRRGGDKKKADGSGGNAKPKW
eukprot:CAMPEP_0197842500 /NCGR_PEP_ID=MMETSP1437-20131217/46774_1 /TAXON_ID=49252 ORGANISM="Eucampia antarctica, Strain CCMP1452" /NCGR_SAMPLE_ID=MMETSP1437 /ASSEMBLY_ACC=CAM_ASM_001096 /LENGTH=275 /DNA_ID=CAMNT_0043452383 /DNA_START=293 /DNA_END=1117 /DNA_ORIENTATION=-